MCVYVAIMVGGYVVVLLINKDYSRLCTHASIILRPFLASSLFRPVNPAHHTAACSYQSPLCLSAIVHPPGNKNNPKTNQPDYVGYQTPQKRCFSCNVQPKSPAFDFSLNQ